MQSPETISVMLGGVRWARPRLPERQVLSAWNYRIGLDAVVSAGVCETLAADEREQSALRRATRLLTSGECGRLRPTAPGARPSSAAGVSRLIAETLVPQERERLMSGAGDDRTHETGAQVETASWTSVAFSDDGRREGVPPRGVARRACARETGGNLARSGDRFVAAVYEARPVRGPPAALWAAGTRPHTGRVAGSVGPDPSVSARVLRAVGLC
jgi:hypothetical protein